MQLTVVNFPGNGQLPHMGSHNELVPRRWEAPGRVPPKGDETILEKGAGKNVPVGAGNMQDRHKIKANFKKLKTDRFDRFLMAVGDAIYFSRENDEPPSSPKKLAEWRKNLAEEPQCTEQTPIL